MMITRRTFILLGSAVPFLGLAAGAGCGGGSSTSTQPNQDQIPTYDIMSLGDRFSRIVAINNQGQILGYDRSGEVALTGLDGSLSVIKPPTTVIQDPLLRVVPVDLNDVGAVLGKYASPDTLGRSFLCQDGVAQDLGTLGGRICSGEALNNRNQVVGSANVTELGRQRPFLWQDGQIRELVTPDGNGVLGQRITNDGVVMGYFYRPELNPDGTVQTGFALLEKGVVRRITPRTGGNFFPSDINDRGQILGTGAGINPQGNPDTAVYIYENDTMTNITAKGGEPDFTNPRAINSRGAVVGTVDYYGSAEGPPPAQKEPRAFLYQSGKTYNLQTLIPANSGWILADAGGINDEGQIFGTGLLNGQAAPFLLTKR